METADDELARASACPESRPRPNLFNVVSVIGAVSGLIFGTAAGMRHGSIHLIVGCSIAGVVLGSMARFPALVLVGTLVVIASIFDWLKNDILYGAIKRRSGTSQYEPGFGKGPRPDEEIGE